jgi:hypothetical protein
VQIYGHTQPISVQQQFNKERQREQIQQDTLQQVVLLQNLITDRGRNLLALGIRTAELEDVTQLAMVDGKVVQQT